MNKRITLLMFMIFMVSMAMLPRSCRCLDITFAWDVDNPDSVPFDGFYLYQRTNDEQYDFNQPISQLIGPGSRTYILKDVMSGIKRWVMKCKIEDKYSKCSNEALYDVPLREPSGIRIEFQ